MNNMDESWMLNYDDVFFCYHTEKGKVFDKTIDHHMLVFVHSGELTNDYELLGKDMFRKIA